MSESDNSSFTNQLYDHLEKIEKQFCCLPLIFPISHPIKTICLIIVVDQEVKPLLQLPSFIKSPELSKSFLNLCEAYKGRYGTMETYILQVSKDSTFNHRISGYTNVSAIASLLKQIINPDLVISFGTAGGINLELGSVVLGQNCYFIDQMRLGQKKFEWGLWGGKTVGLKGGLENIIKGNVGSQLGYGMNRFQQNIIKKLDIVCLDMECASIANILQQVQINFMVVKVISNGIYPSDLVRQEHEYAENREWVSNSASKVLEKLLQYIDGKRIEDL